MAILSWTDFVSGDTLATIRAKINGFSTAVVSQVNTNTTGLAALLTSFTSPKEKVEFEILTELNIPPYQEGIAYYNDEYGAVVVTGNVEGVTTEIGHNMHIHVINNTGAIIEKGMACIPDGTAGGVLQAKKAIATTFANAAVIGLASTDIAIGGVGALTALGDLRNMNTNGMVTGQALYLSDTVPGTFGTTKPAIKTVVGGVLIADATEGHFYVRINRNISLPLMLGDLLDATAPTSLPADLVNYTPVTLYNDNIEIVTTTDKTAGTITPLLDGTYRVNISLHMFFDNVGGAGKKEIYVAVRDVTDNVIVKEIRGFILKDAETYDVTDNGAAVLEGTHEYRLEIRSELALNNFAFSSSTFYIESIIY